MMIDFIDRQKELGHLDSLKKVKPAPFIVIVGRRRVGKTRLVSEFIKNKNSAYFFVEEKKPQLLLDDFSDVAGQGVVFRDWEAYLRYVLANFDIVVIDEFQNFNRVDPSFYSTLQKLLDQEGSRAMLVAVGSYVGMMNALFENKKSPLFGRATEIWNLPPLPRKDIMRLIKGNLENKISVYSMFGGYPKYYVILHQYQVFEIDNIWSDLIVRKYSPLNREPHNILLLEFGGEYRTYFSLLEAIAKGKASYVDIANYTGISTTTLARYLDDLLAFGVIEKRFPITEGPRSKKSRYFISDQFIKFWFRYIFPNVDLIESERYSDLLKMIKKDFSVFLSMEFEQMVRDVVKSAFPKVGSWWNRRGDEIDVVGIDSKKRVVIFGEVKWTSRKIGWDYMKVLVAKSELVKGFSRYEKRFLLVSKSGFTSECRKKMDQEGIINWDLGSFGKILRQSPDLISNQDLGRG